LQSLLEPRPEVLEAYLFGSWARGQAQPHIDVDVAVYLDESKLPQLPYGYEAELGAACISALGSNRVDIVVLNDASPMLYYRVLRDGVRLLT
jgi:predicted nucleotidyltransferase